MRRGHRPCSIGLALVAWLMVDGRQLQLRHREPSDDDRDRDDGAVVTVSDDGVLTIGVLIPQGSANADIGRGDRHVPWSSP